MWLLLYIAIEPASGWCSVYRHLRVKLYYCMYVHLKIRLLSPSKQNIMVFTTISILITLKNNVWITVSLSVVSRTPYNNVTWALWRLKSPATRSFCSVKPQNTSKLSLVHCEGHPVVTVGFSLQWPVMHKICPCSDIPWIAYNVTLS